MAAHRTKPSLSRAARRCAGRRGAARARRAARRRGRAASGEWLLFLHADCRLEPGWEEAVEAFIAAPEAAGRAGYFDLALDDPAPAARRLERIVAWRCRVLALPYGDQGLLIARTLYDASRRLRAIAVDGGCRSRAAPRPPPACALSASRCIASARRYRHDGYHAPAVAQPACLSLYFAGVPPDRIVRLYG